MSIDIQNLYFPEVKLISPKIFGDERGFFLETFNTIKFEEIGIQDVFVQDNLSMSKRGTLRGLHYQLLNPQDKLVFVSYGKVLDVFVDIRLGSPKFGHFQSIELDGSKMQFFPMVFCIFSHLRCS